MKHCRGICLFALIATIGLSSFAESPKKIGKSRNDSNDPIRLKLMSYNIRIGVGGGNWNGDPTKVNLAPIAKIISAQKVDFVGLQEVDRFRQRSGGLNQPKWLSDHLSLKMAFEPAYSIPTKTVLTEDFGVALLTRNWIHSFERFTLFKPDYSKSHPNYPEYFSEPRILLHTLASVRSKMIHVFVTHLGLTPDQRAEQVRQIVEIMAQYEGPKILLGDFNAEPTSAEMSPLFKEYRDALSEGGVKNEERKSFPAGDKPKEAFDYIFLSKEFRVRNAKVIHDTTLASDHNPVFAEVELQP